ncbi:ATP-dependent zinc metalloprotease FtsH [Aquisphaera giovannonii]|uniref:ATP-dependent zinc metalloprotease FtsH n=1 Tax=Aquisphaera giovannonii TaxID=406548 RepID=A0A5B9WB85_9BACT|nr:ATP-dependent zinc metalloprotease FtsH [Aquisphaera giovannonii]QEH37529.1 ATP-dependent zinc metalloprotease FtsH [Aquisphaera giovannonii]
MENRPPQQDPPRRPLANGRKPNNAGGSPTPPWLWLLLIGAFAIIFIFWVPKPETTVDYNPWFLDQVEANNIKRITIQANEIRGELRAETPYLPSGSSTSSVKVNRFLTYAPTDQALDATVNRLRGFGKDGKDPVAIEGSPINGANGLVWIMLLLPTFLILGIFYLMMRRARDQFDGGILGTFVKSSAKRHDKSKQRTTFEEVAGLENAKGELQEIVEFLKSPEKFQKLGGRIPKGVLLIGPPGTGKTLLGRAVAGEAGVPFYSISGSEFIQMFVGVGASRVRDMFKTARENSPCILFIDEIDAVGRIRGAGLGGGHDEREQTLNQILTEMDGFSPSESVIVLAATNRPDVLDPALLRPGRFDRHVTVDLPTKKGRLEILKVHTRSVPLSSDVDLDRIARNTVGMSGADLANLVNEAALLATREDKQAVDAADLEAALDKVILGAKREEVITDKDKRATAYHEVGHALVGWLTPRSDPVHKVTIIPRGRSLGVTQFMPEEDRVSYNESQIKAKLYMMMGGRAAERLIYDDLSTGAAQDLDQATRLVRKMVTQWGMSERVGPVSFRTSSEHPFLGREMSEPRDHSEHMQQIIDEEVGRILREADEHAFRLLESHRDEMERLTEALIEREVLTESEITNLIGKRAGLDDEPAVSRAHDDPVVATADNPPL